MNCDQARELLGLYLDSELDGRSTAEVRAHLDECRECAWLFQAEQTFDSVLRARLKPSAPTAALWNGQEAFVSEAFKERAGAEAEASPPARGPARRASFWREFLWPVPSYYAGLAVVWVLLLVFRPAAPASAGQPTVARGRMSPETRFALLEQRREMWQLLASPEPVPEKPRQETLPPRSERGDAGQKAA